MYKCNICDFEDDNISFCDKCNVFLECDCSDIETGRLKDLYIDYDNGTATVTLNYSICSCCGEIMSTEVV